MDVLVIDDDPAVRAIYVRTLSAEGHQVHEAGSPTDALRVLEERPFHAIVCDFHMPDMDGAAFHSQLSERMPHLAGRVLFVTGWAGDPGVRDQLERTGRPVLEKPVYPTDLVHAVRAITGW